VRNHAIKFSQIFRASRTRDQNIVDILHASQISRRDFKDGIAEIGCLMGMQYGFELALSFPPLQKIGFGISCARSRVEVFLQLVAYPFVNGMRCPWIMAFRRQLRQPEALLALLSASPL